MSVGSTGTRTGTTSTSSGGTSLGSATRISGAVATPGYYEDDDEYYYLTSSGTTYPTGYTSGYGGYSGYQTYGQSYYNPQTVSSQMVRTSAVEPTAYAIQDVEYGL